MPPRRANKQAANKKNELVLDHTEIDYHTNVFAKKPTEKTLQAVKAANKKNGFASMPERVIPATLGLDKDLDQNKLFQHAQILPTTGHSGTPSSTVAKFKNVEAMLALTNDMAPARNTASSGSRLTLPRPEPPASVRRVMAPPARPVRQAPAESDGDGALGPKRSDRGQVKKPMAKMGDSKGARDISAKSKKSGLGKVISGFNRYRDTMKTPVMKTGINHETLIGSRRARSSTPELSLPGPSAPARRNRTARQASAVRSIAEDDGIDDNVDDDNSLFGSGSEREITPEPTEPEPKVNVYDRIRESRAEMAKKKAAKNATIPKAVPDKVLSEQDLMDMADEYMAENPDFNDGQ